MTLIIAKLVPNSFAVGPEETNLLNLIRKMRNILGSFLFGQTLQIYNVFQKNCQAICGTINPYEANSHAQDINFIRFATHNATGNFVAISGWYVFVKGIAIKQNGKQSFFPMHCKFIFSGQHLPKEAGAKYITTRKILDSKFKFGRSLSS